jgi:hypothetical protein
MLTIIPGGDPTQFEPARRLERARGLFIRILKRVP